MTIKNTVPAQLITSQVKLALQEDIGQQDLTAELIPINSQATATLITREPATLCGKDWFNEVFLQLDPSITIDWNFTDGDRLSAESIICTLTGSARTLLTGERIAMNYIQTLSATATLVQLYTDQIRDLPVQILDTRKTIPGFRLAQKYAVRCGGGYNHRVGLFDGILIKENHISATGSIDAAVNKAQQLYPNIAIEVEVETLNELEQALSAQADIILLDNFDIPTLKQAVKINKGQAKLEASGGITIESIRPIAKTGIDRISIGALTKDIRAIDLSMRFS
ncbi:MAG TPA: carboxylating nicotinate-nucleotide diphosphorylase [Methylophaga sp.]|nr:carboxylating nicotinate-nucleotide diphosphorylase [Methylophaga sp.]